MTITEAPAAEAAAALARQVSRAGYAAGLRHLADIIDSHDQVPVPVDGHLTPVIIGFTGPDAGDEMAAAAALIPCEWTPKFAQGSHGVLYGLEGRLDGLRVKLHRYVEGASSPEAYANARLDALRRAVAERAA